jgi:hypothetical protein
MCIENEGGVLMTDGEIMKLIIAIKDELKKDINGVYDAINKVRDTQSKHGEAIAVINKTLSNGINERIRNISEKINCIEVERKDEKREKKKDRNNFGSWIISISAICISAILTIIKIVGG